jgi:uncharacterized SAM-binding protein YcdF (DUF218 family)
VRRITVTIRGNDNAHRVPSALVTKSTRSKRRTTRKELLTVPALFRRRQIWLPTWQGALLLVVVIAVASLIALRHLATYLAVHDPAATRDGRGASTLIVEGWLEEDGLDAAIALIAGGRYARVIASGGPIEGWREGRSWPTYAERAADYLRRHGVTAIPVVAVAVPESAQDRTFRSAVAVREWLRRQGVAIDAVDLFSSGVHARRSRLVFQMAFGSEVNVGVFATAPERYALERWWMTSEGVKAVLGEAIGLAWTACCFAPRAPVSHEERLPPPRSPA